MKGGRRPGHVTRAKRRQRRRQAHVPRAGLGLGGWGGGPGPPPSGPTSPPPPPPPPRGAGARPPRRHAGPAAGRPLPPAGPAPGLARPARPVRAPGHPGAAAGRGLRLARGSPSARGGKASLRGEAAPAMRPAGLTGRWRGRAGVHAWRPCSGLGARVWGGAVGDEGRQQRVPKCAGSAAETSPDRTGRSPVPERWGSRCVIPGPQPRRRGAGRTVVTHFTVQKPASTRHGGLPSASWSVRQIFRVAAAGSQHIARQPGSFLAP